jgi:hypothetical protein
MHIISSNGASVCLLAILLTCVLTLFSGRGTTFDHPSRDPWNKMGSKSHLACVSHRKPPTTHAQHLIDLGLLVAHKTIPCYTVLSVCVPRTKLCSEAIVADWGPVHADIDLYVPLSKKIHHNGDERVTWSLRSGMN